MDNEDEQEEKQITMLCNIGCHHTEADVHDILAALGFQQTYHAIDAGEPNRGALTAFQPFTSIALL